jgi:hypothetical protein
VLLRPDDLVHDDAAPLRAEVLAQILPRRRFPVHAAAGSRVGACCRWCPRTTITRSASTSASGSTPTMWWPSRRRPTPVDGRQLISFERDPVAGSAARPFRRSSGRCANPTVCSVPRPRPVADAAARSLPARHLSLVFAEGEPVLWWSPDPRMVLVPARSPHHALAAQGACATDRFEVRCDSDSKRSCAPAPHRATARTAPGSAEEMIAAYWKLFTRGSRALASKPGATAAGGGLYGMAIGRMFYGESMFSLERRCLQGGDSPPCPLP